MKKVILLFLFGLLIKINGFSQNEPEHTQTQHASPSLVATHTAGKQLVKGAWSLGGTLSAKSNSFSDIDLLVVDVQNFDQRALNFRVEGSYFFRENLSAGLGLQFGEEKADLTANLLNNSFKREIRNYSRSYGVLAFLKNHIPMSGNNIFFITNQTELYYGYKSGPSETYIEDILERKYSSKRSYGIGIRPGILIFFTENFAFDINMGILGFSHSVQNVEYQYPPNNPPSEANRKEHSRNRSTDLNLKFDLLKVGFGFSFFFN